MSDVDKSIANQRLGSPSIDPSLLESPAVGVVTGEANGPQVAATVLRANKNGHHVLVSSSDETDPEVIDFASTLGATLVELGNTPNEDDVRRELSATAREIGFPGLFVKENLGERIDFRESRSALTEATDYCVSAISRSTAKNEPRIVVGIPAHNEEIAIGSTVVSALTYADEVVVVDDGSDDRTNKVAREAGATVISHEENRGKGAALRTLFDHVRDQPFDALVVLDGDGQHYPQEIPEVVEPVIEDETDIVIGSRYINGQGNGETPAYRRFGQHVLDLLTIGSANQRVTDSQSGFRALSPIAVDRMRLRTNGFGVESEMIDRAVQTDLDIVERPINVRYNGLSGSNENPFKHGLSVVNFILQLVRDRHPLVFFGIPGVIVMTFGVLYGVQGIVIYQSSGQFYPAKALVSGFLTIVGVLGMFLGLVLNSISNRVAEIKDSEGGEW